MNKKDVPEELIVKVEKLSNLGYGIAKYNGYVIFVENACPEDEVRVKIYKKNKNFAQAKIVEIITPSPYRVEAFCPIQKVCGACQLQFIDYEYQLKLKKEIVTDAMRNIYGNDIIVNDVIPSPTNRAYRHKIQYPISETQNSKRIVAGYYKTGSHELVNVKYCPIQPEYCDEIIEYIRKTAQELGVSGYKEKEHSGELRHVVIRSSKKNGSNLVVLVVNSTTLTKKVQQLAKCLYSQFANIAGVCVNFNPKKTNLILGKKTQLLEGVEFIEEDLCDKTFKIGAKTFFQVNPQSADNIFRYVKNYIAKNYDNPVILDAYAGIATFGICLSDVAQNVVCVEEVKESILLANSIVNENGIKNIELHSMDAGIFFEQELTSNKRKFDVTVLDPPRKGCSQESLEYALQLTKKEIIYVSCNPATLARDLKYLKEKGCTIDFIQPFDMFPHTYHIENVAIIKV